MIKTKKFFSIALIAATLVTVSSATIMPSVNAATISHTQEADKIKNDADAIKLIEEKFLTTNADGTTTIAEKAKQYIDADLLNQIQKGSNQINNKIKSGDLIFDAKNKSLHEKQKAKACTYVDGDYIWHWYGFDFIMDGYNAGIFGSKLAQYAAILAGGAAVTTIIPACSIACACSSATVAYWSSVAWEGNATGNGCIGYYYGDPSWAQLYSVEAR